MWISWSWSKWWSDRFPVQPLSLPINPSGYERACELLVFNTDGLNGMQCVQLRRACSVGASPTGEEVRIPVAWIVSVEETKPVKLIDKAIFGMVSESPGRNVSEPTGGLVNL